MNIENLSAAELVKHLVQITAGNNNQTISKLIADATEKNIKISDVIGHINQQECNKPAKSLREMSNEELRNVEIDDLLDSLVKPDKVIYVDRGSKPYHPVHVPEEPSLPYIRRLEVVFHDCGVKTIGDLLDKQQSGDLKVSTIFTDTINSLEHTASSSYVPRKEGRAEVKSFMDVLERMLTIDINASHVDVQQGNFYNQIRGVTALAEQLNEKFAEKEEAVLKTDAALWINRTSNKENPVNAAIRQ